MATQRNSAQQMDAVLATLGDTRHAERHIGCQAIDILRRGAKRLQVAKPLGQGITASRRHRSAYALVQTVGAKQVEVETESMMGIHITGAIVESAMVATLRLGFTLVGRAKVFLIAYALIIAHIEPTHSQVDHQRHEREAHLCHAPTTVARLCGTQDRKSVV